MSEGENQPVSISGSITDVLGLGKGVNVLVGSIERGIGKVFGPWQRKRENRAEIANAEEWAAALGKQGLQITGGDLSLGERTMARLMVDAVRQQIAREAIALEAVEDFKRITGGGTDAEPSPPEPEWVDRFWRLAGEVTSDDMKSLWGRVLARQISGDAKISARTLDFLSTLSGAEANLIAKLAAVVCQCDTITSERKALLVRGLPHSKDKKMEGLERRLAGYTEEVASPHLGAIGVFYESGMSSSVYGYIKDDKVRLRIGGKRFVLMSYVTPLAARYRPGECDVGNGEELTWLGRELLSLIDAEPDPAYLRALTEAYGEFGWVLRPEKD
ncbi:DUF2806 domain-containing protein [Mesorhizobium abyssinicae]|uniref:DUF2806 domain-containing protein n=1 Tax=Mesorhizobium abyssinicae TaxID=1209958 RepID=UPI002A246B76|nr:DUF2806 domain-containing protein [Mesorhizobium abyssinicae]MDX8434212.1 DUF2806 domain-containing protein [Mesorhizobium abyssinicae]